MPEDVKKHFAYPNFTTPVPEAYREVLDSDTPTRGKSYLNGLGTTKCESGGVPMMMKKVM